MRATPGALLVRRWPGGAYRGFDGAALWPDELLLDVVRTNGLAELDQFAALDAIARANTTAAYDAVIVAHVRSVIAAPDGIELIGYDFGWVDDEYSRFSSIRNEAMRTSPELREAGLNEHGLLATLADVDRYAAIRESLRRAGRDIETAGPQQYAIMVFARPL